MIHINAVTTAHATRSKSCRTTHNRVLIERYYPSVLINEHAWTTWMIFFKNRENARPSTYSSWFNISRENKGAKDSWIISSMELRSWSIRNTNHSLCVPNQRLLLRGWWWNWKEMGPTLLRTRKRMYGFLHTRYWIRMGLETPGMREVVVLPPPTVMLLSAQKSRLCQNIGIQPLGVNTAYATNDLIWESSSFKTR